MDRHHGWYVSAKPLFIGLILSILLIAGAIWISLFNGSWIKSTLFILAIVQATVQLIFFMHLGVEEKPRWNLITFWLLTLMVFVIVAGSIWIMYHLNYNMGMSH